MGPGGAFHSIRRISTGLFSTVNLLCLIMYVMLTNTHSTGGAAPTASAQIPTPAMCTRSGGWRDVPDSPSLCDCSDPPPGTLATAGGRVDRRSASCQLRVDVRVLTLGWRGLLSPGVRHDEAMARAARHAPSSQPAASSLENLLQGLDDLELLDRALAELQLERERLGRRLVVERERLGPADASRFRLSRDLAANVFARGVSPGGNLLDETRAFSACLIA